MRCPWTSTTLKCSKSLKFFFGVEEAYLAAPVGGAVARKPRHRYVGSCNFGGNMNQSELVVHVAAAAGLNKADAGKAVEAVFAGITDALKKGEEARFAGFGTFKVSERWRPARGATRGLARA